MCIRDRRNLLTLSEAGATVLPPEPAFYLRPSKVSDIVDALVDRRLQALGVSEAPSEEQRGAERSSPDARRLAPSFPLPTGGLMGAWLSLCGAPATFGRSSWPRSSMIPTTGIA